MSMISMSVTGITHQNIEEMQRSQDGQNTKDQEGSLPLPQDAIINAKASDIFDTEITRQVIEEMQRSQDGQNTKDQEGSLPSPLNVIVNPKTSDTSNGFNPQEVEDSDYEPNNSRCFDKHRSKEKLDQCCRNYLGCHKATLGIELMGTGAGIGLVAGYLLSTFCWAPGIACTVTAGKNLALYKTGVTFASLGGAITAVCCMGGATIGHALYAIEAYEC